MLARVANSLYWIGRYIERSEHLARYLRVQYFSILDTPMFQNRDFVLRSILTMYGIESKPDEHIDEAEMLMEVGLNMENPVSFASTVAAARENARSVRHVLSTELWEVINQYYLYVRDFDRAFFKTRGLFDFTNTAGKHCSIVRSFADHTLIHDEVWTFIQLGISLERATQILRILDSKGHDIEVLSENGANRPLQRYQWTITLKVLEAFDMHRRAYRQSQTQESVVEFLLSNNRFPRSVAYNLNTTLNLIKDLSAQTKSSEELIFKAGKLSSDFQYLEYADIKDNLPNFLNESMQKVFQLSSSIEKTYFKIGESPDVISEIIEEGN